MRRLRLLVARHPAAVSWLLACALAVRLLVPGGFMPVAGPAGVVLALCPGAAAAMPMAAMHHGAAHHDPAPIKPEPPCAFAGLGLAALDPPVPAILLLAPVLALLLAARGLSRLSTRPAGRWRPPLRAPPVPA